MLTFILVCTLPGKKIILSVFGIVQTKVETKVEKTNVESSSSNKKSGENVENEENKEKEESSSSAPARRRSIRREN